MFRRLAYVLSSLVFAISILGISIFKASTPALVFGESFPQIHNPTANTEIVYEIPDSGSILPNSILWNIKAFRDRISVMTQKDSYDQSEYYLDLADSRLAAADTLINQKQFVSGVTTLTKAEKYLEMSFQKATEAKKSGRDIDMLLARIAQCSLYHLGKTKEYMGMVPEDARPLIAKAQDYPRRFYEQSRNGLLERGQTPPPNPFDN